MRLQLVNGTPRGSGTTVTINGEVARYVTKVTLEVDAGMLTKAHITYAVTEFDVDMEIDDAEVTEEIG